MAKLGKDETVQLDTLLKICEVLECDIEEIVEFKNGGEIIMANNHEREELHKAIWSIADDLRGSVDGWDFKQYILGIMFYRYISENITNYINEGERKAGDTTFDYTKLADADAEYERENLVKEKGFFIRPSELFCNVIKAAKSDTATFTDVEGKTKSVKDNLNEYLEMIFNNIENSAKGAESEDDFSGLFDDIDVNSNKLGATVTKRNEKLVKILDGIAGINLGNYQDNNIDAFGDAYEFLMSMYASNAGKSGGEFYTPQEVSELLTRLAIVGKTSVNKVYDPACGSGSLLLKSAKILGKDNVRNGFFGQEINLTTYNLCRINMFLHDIDYDKFNIACEDTLISPMHWDDEPFEVIVSNPPYSIKWAGDDNAVLINDPRYSPAGVLAPKSKADFAFIMHSLSWLATNGVASIVCFPGILYRGGAEQKIRKYLIDNNFVDCIIQLPDNLFFGTSIATCIMVLKKSKRDNNTLFIDATNYCVKVTNNNRLTDKNIIDIVDIYTAREDKEQVAKVVSNEDIANNDYNLSVSNYVEKEDTREKIDIVGLNKEIDEIVEKENILRNEINKIIAEIEV
jgi:type I restriction enzyme M protein